MIMSPPSACQRLFRSERSIPTNNDNRDGNNYRRILPVAARHPVVAAERSSTNFARNMMPTMILDVLTSHQVASFEPVLKENVFCTPYSKTSRVLNKSLLKLPSLEEDGDDASPEVATCIVSRHEVSDQTLLCTEDDENVAITRRQGQRVTPLFDGDDDDSSDDEHNPRSARINLASRFEQALDNP